MAVLTAYFDESDNADAAVVAGFIAEADQWIKFQTEWNDFLKHYGVAALHMKHYAHSTGEFASWRGQTNKRREFLASAISIIKRRIRVPIVSVLHRKDYDSFVNTPARRTAFGSHYTTSAYLCLLMTGYWADDFSEHDPIAYVFDQGNTQKSNFQRAFDLSKANPASAKQNRLGSLTFADDANVFPLQASDLLAYEASKFWADYNSTARHNQRRASLKTLIHDLNDKYMRVATAPLLRKIATDLGV